MLVQKSLGRHDEARRAITALLAVVVHEGCRDRMGLAVRNAFDGLDVLALRVDGQDGAAVHGFAVDDDGAGAAGGPVAHALGAGQIQMIAQRVEQGNARLQSDGHGLPLILSVRDGARARQTAAPPAARRPPVFPAVQRLEHRRRCPHRE